MGYQTSWLTHGHDIALLKSQKAYYAYLSRRIVEKTEARFPKRERLLGSLKMSGIYNLLIL